MAARWSRLLELAEEEVRRTRARLPGPLLAQAEALPVVCEEHPNAAQLADGIEQDTLGLFVGEPFADTGATTAPLPAQIILFLGNLWDAVEGDEREFRFEVRTTYLHELGHYLGLDELDLEERGLE